MHQTAIIFNPAAKGEKARRFADQLASLSPDVEVEVTTAPGDATSLAAAAVARGCTTVIAAGGDGTINHVVNGIGEAGVNLGILPVGTMNVFACELGIPANDLQKGWEIIQAGHVRAIDLPRANDHYFVQLAGIGLDAQVVEETDRDFRKTFGPLTYLISAAQIAARKPPVIRVHPAHGSARTGSFVLVGNGRFYGGPFELFKEAHLDDGELDVLIFKNLGHLDIMRYMQGIVMGSHTSMKDVEYFQTPSVRIESGEDLPVEVDGEVVGRLPFDFRFASRKLHVLAPAKHGGPA